MSVVALVLAGVSLAISAYVTVESPYYRDTLRILAYLAFGTGVVAALVGVVAGVKRAPLGWAAVLLGAAGAGWQFSWAV